MVIGQIGFERGKTGYGDGKTGFGNMRNRFRERKETLSYRLQSPHEVHLSCNKKSFIPTKSVIQRLCRCEPKSSILSIALRNWCVDFLLAFEFSFFF